VAGFEEGAGRSSTSAPGSPTLVVHDNGVLRFVRIQLMGGEDVTRP
jgi:hypothetical protein